MPPLLHYHLNNFLKIIAGLVLMLYSTAAICQNARFKHYSSDEGFTGAAFKTIVQDSLGFLWISSGSGLYKFDGYTFIRYKAALSDSLGLLQGLDAQRGLVLRVDPTGKVWVSFRNHIAWFDRNQDSFVSYKLPSGVTRPEAMWFENEKKVWLGTSGKGLLCFDISGKETLTHLIFDRDARSIIPANTIHAIADEGEALLLGTQNGIWRFRKANKQFSRPNSNPADSALILSGDVKMILPRKGHMWLWIDDQLVKVDSNFSVVQKLGLEIILEKFDFAKRFVDSRVMGITQDKNGKFWIATQGLGLVYFDPDRNQLENFRYNEQDDESLPSDILNHVMIDRDQNLWVTTVNKGIVRMNKPSIIFHNYFHGVSSTGIDVIASHGSNLLLVGTNGKSLWRGTLDDKDLAGVKFDRVDFTPPVRGLENIVELLPGKKKVWLGTMQAGVAGIDMDQLRSGDIGQPLLLQHDETNPNTISGNFISAFWEDAAGHLWVGTLSDGLNIVDCNRYGTEGSVIKYTHDPNDDESLSHSGISDMMQDDDGSLLIATFNGLDRVANPVSLQRKLKFEHLMRGVYCTRICKTKDGSLFVSTKVGLYQVVKTGNKYQFVKAPLPGDPNVTYMEEDRLGRLWMMSFEGLFFYDRKKKFVLVFKKEDGLPSSRSVTAAESSQTPEGTMVFSNGEGLTIFNPLTLQVNDSKPHPLITQLRINNKAITSSHQDDESYLPESISTLKEISLNHKQNVLVIEFSAMDLTAPEKNMYMYSLEGFDKNWIHTDWKNRTATYTNLEPGNYIFHVKASNRDGLWSDHVRTLSIKVLPPPWKTWWAYSLYGVVLAGLLFAARRNIIRQERLASTLKVEHLELEKTLEIDRLRSTFFTNISHEFRTPLTLIQGPAQNLLDKLRKEKQIHAGEGVPQLDLILQNSNRLLRLVNQVLDLSRLESGGLKKEFVEDDVFSFLKQVVSQFASLALQKRIAIGQDFPAQVAIVRFDKDKLEKIISNLIFNALKFTPTGGHIKITSALTFDAGGFSAHHLVIHISDSGPGILPHQLEKIFERFYRASEGDNQNAGTGIGLALSKELAEFLGGSISVKSSIGEGSTFTVRLPVEFIETRNEGVILPDVELDGVVPEHPPKNGKPHDQPEEKPLILIVEDHVELRKFIISCLGEEYHFIEADNGSEGFRQTIDQMPTLILSDIMMSEMDGVEMCRKIKHDPRTCHIPVILLTAKAGEDDKVTGLGAGADDYLIKPFHQDELVLRIRNQVSTQRRFQEKIRLDLLSGGSAVMAISSDEKFIARVKNIIESRMQDEKLGVESLAAEIGLSRVQLYRKVSALTGMPVNDFIRKLRLKRGAQLLAQNWGPIAQVAYEVGFSNPSYFSKCFKEEFGVLPPGFLEKNKG